jgi:hypothetical protein
MRAAFLAAQTGFTDTVIDPEWTSLINAAYLDFAWETEFNQEEVSLFSVANQAEYSLDTARENRYFKFIKDVSYGVSASLWESSEVEESRADPLWYTRGMGTPSRYLVARPNILRLLPKPAQGHDLIIVRGIREPRILTDDGQEPAFPGVWHEALALKAAWDYTKAWVGAADAERVSSYLGQYKRMVTECKDYLGHSRYGTIHRLVRRPSRPRTWGTSFPRY